MTGYEWIQCLVYDKGPVSATGALYASRPSLRSTLSIFDGGFIVVVPFSAMPTCTIVTAMCVSLWFRVVDAHEMQRLLYRPSHIFWWKWIKIMYAHVSISDPQHSRIHYITDLSFLYIEIKCKRRRTCACTKKKNTLTFQISTRNCIPKRMLPDAPGKTREGSLFWKEEGLRLRESRRSAHTRTCCRIFHFINTD